MRKLLMWLIDKVPKTTATEEADDVMGALQCAACAPAPNTVTGTLPGTLKDPAEASRAL